MKLTLTHLVTVFMSQRAGSLEPLAENDKADKRVRKYDLRKRLTVCLIYLDQRRQCEGNLDHRLLKTSQKTEVSCVLCFGKRRERKSKC